MRKHNDTGVGEQLEDKPKRPMGSLFPRGLKKLADKPKRPMGSLFPRGLKKLAEAHLALHGPAKSGLGFVWRRYRVFFLFFRRKGTVSLT
jgi:hypothetical protein